MDSKINNIEEDKKFEIIWIESNGAGYCLTEKDYNKRKKESEQHNKKQSR